MLNPTFKYADLLKISLNTNIPLLELEIILSEILQIDRFILKAKPETVVNIEQANKFYKLLNQRIQKIPLAYILNKASFWDLDLFINQDVLVPRSATELLVNKVLDILPKNINATILELGTGSGAISLAIAKHRPLAKIVATDLSEKALQVANTNAKNLAINNIKFLCSDWFKSDYFKTNPKFDIIISNPPYIATEEISLCDPEIFFEPKIALFAERQGLSCLQHIIARSPNYLNKQGVLLLEHGFKQKDSIISMLQHAQFSTIDAYQDLAGLDRVILGRL